MRKRGRDKNAAIKLYDSNPICQIVGTEICIAIDISKFPTRRSQNCG